MDANGGSAASATESLTEIHQALQIVHSPTSANDARRTAQDYLQKLKDSPEAPLHGYHLANDKSQEPVVRHYALSLLEHAIRYQWSQYTEDQAEALRGWVVELNHGLQSTDPSYLRNKTAQLWVEVAKRAWGSEWMDMDSMLYQMWEAPVTSGAAVHKEAAMIILETLSDEVFNGDDAVVESREGVLSKACVEIFTPTAVLAEAFPNRQAGPDVRHGSDGWLSRLSQFLEYCLTMDAKDSGEVKNCSLKALSAFLSLMVWAIPKAIASAKCVEVMNMALRSSDTEVQKASLEALHALFSRTNFNDEEFEGLVLPLYSQQSVQLFRELYDWACVDAEDIDDDKYQVLKKLTELLSSLGDYFERKMRKVPVELANNFLQLLVVVVQNQSLMVSIPVLLSWTRILSRGSQLPADTVSAVIGPLLDVCSSRLVRYEHLPEDSSDPTYLFLMEDTDTVPERHAFLGNYRRYSTIVIENIVQLRLSEAMAYILSSTEEVLLHLYDGQPPLEKSTYTKHSMPALRVDARFTVVEASLKGFQKWKKHKHGEPGAKQQAVELENSMEAWCQKILAMSFEDPMVRKRTLQLLVYFSTTGLKHRPEFMLKVLEHILMTWPALEPDFRAYNDAIKELQGESMVELQRLASEVPDHLLGVYDQIEAQVNGMMANGALDEKRTIAYRSFLFIIIHRASQMSTDAKIGKLQEFINPVKNLWQQENVRTSLQSYDNFCSFLGLDKAQAYLTTHRANDVADWGSVPLDQEGLALQADLEERLKALPLRPTKSFLAFSVERLDKSSAAFQASYALWEEGFGNILKDLLDFLRFAHATHNPDNWAGLPQDMRGVVDRVLSDRFWQAGISDGSKEDFYTRVMDKKGTLEGLASSIRASVRFVRETAYAIIYCMSRLDAAFYGFEGLSEPLSKALFADSTWLSTHQQTNLLNLVRYLVDDCPVQFRELFLPQLLGACFSQMDVKIHGEWEKLAQQQTIDADGDDALKEEMKSESILRSVTYAAVVMVADFLDPNKLNPKSTTAAAPNGNAQQAPNPQEMNLRKFCLSHQQIMEPLLMFCLHGIRMRDTRSCGMVLRFFVTLIPEYRSNTPPGTPSDGNHEPHPMMTAIRDFISLDVLQACITSFHEPYFVDLQKELATLIAAIVVNYSPLTNKPRDVILSLPNINPAGLERLVPYMQKPSSHPRQQRAIIQDLLKDLKGVSVAEMGKLPKSSGLNSSRRKTGERSQMAQQFMESNNANGRSGARGNTPDGLDGVANLFDLQE